MRILILRLLFACLLGAAVAPTGYAADTNSPQDGPDLTKARAAIKVKKYDVALTELRAIKTPNADVYSLMGFSLRKSGDQAQSMTYYRKALEAEPNHRGALEYQGELYVEMGQIDKAKENLAKLDKLCLFSCEEQRDLKEAIAHAPQSKSASQVRS
jgi:tetratricopeptide (TPR) repeat protein